MADDVERTLGEHSAKLEGLASDIQEIKNDVKQLIATENKREGGKKVAMMGAGAAGALTVAFLEAAFARLLGK